jgi:hypothetical protein
MKKEEVNQHQGHGKNKRNKKHHQRERNNFDEFQLPDKKAKATNIFEDDRVNVAVDMGIAAAKVFFKIKPDNPVTKIIKAIAKD